MNWATVWADVKPSLPWTVPLLYAAWTLLRGERAQKKATRREEERSDLKDARERIAVLEAEIHVLRVENVKLKGCEEAAEILESRDRRLAVLRIKAWWAIDYLERHPVVVTAIIKDAAKQTQPE